MISIELTPRTQVQLSTAVDKADWFKAAMKDDKSGKLKELWNEYAKGDNPGIITERGIVRGWKWRGKNYMFSKDELKGGKSTNKQRRKKFPASLEKAIAKDGTYADYKKGQTNMRMILPSALTMEGSFLSESTFQRFCYAREPTRSFQRQVARNPMCRCFLT